MEVMTGTKLDFINFTWPMSGGEKAILSLFSSLYEKREISYNFTLFLDEPDLYLHPEWQRKLILLLIEVIPSIFENHEIDIVLTTHSPILLSDIPNDRVIYLKKINEDIISDSSNIIADLSTNHKETFAANIHSIFYDSFFLNNGSIGEFAFQKINNLIKVLVPYDDNNRFNKNESQSEMYDYNFDRLKKIKCNEKNYRKLINYVGEDLIKNKLEKMLNDCIREYNENINVDSLLIEKEFYQKMLQEIEEEINNREQSN